ncbi:cilia- and flagella-associated protein 58-like, partial [Plakobranchus ocellatus]
MNHGLFLQFCDKQREEEVNNLKTETQRQNKMRETIQRKLRSVEDSKADIEQQRETLKGQITGLERELEAAKKQAETDKKAIDDLVRERDILNK